MADAIPIGRRASAAQPKIPTPSKQVEDDLAAKLGADGKSFHLLLTHAKGAAFGRGALIGIVVGLALGWFAYDQTVVRIMAQAQDMALKTQITKGMMDSQIGR